MSIQNMCRVTVTLVAVFIVSPVMAQTPPEYCSTLVDNCHGNTVPDGGIYAGFNGTLAQQQEQWVEFCFAVESADSCLDAVPAECMGAAEVARIHHVGVCTLEYSDFVAVDDCTDTAIIDDQLEACQAAAANTYQSGSASVCTYATALLRCANESFVRHCGELGELFGSMYTRSSVINFAPHLPPDCRLRDSVDRPLPTPPAAAISCEERIFDCIGTDSITLDGSHIERLCPNFYRSGDCLAALADNQCDVEVRVYNNLFNYVCTKSETELRDADECIALVHANNFAQCELRGVGATLCQAATNFMDCIEFMLEQTCKGSVLDTAVELWYASTIPYLEDILPDDCSLLQRLPEILLGRISCPPALNEYDDQCPHLGTSCEDYTRYTDCVDAIIRHTCGSSGAEANVEIWHASFISSIGDNIPGDCPALQRPTSAAAQPTPWFATHLIAVLLVFVFAARECIPR